MGTTRGFWPSLSNPKHGTIMYPDCGKKVVVVWAAEAGLMVQARQYSEENRCIWIYGRLSKQRSLLDSWYNMASNIQVTQKRNIT